jgi:hypothetical protein
LTFFRTPAHELAGYHIRAREYQEFRLDRACYCITNESPSSLGERSNARKIIRVAWGKVLEWVTKASLLSFRKSFGSSAPPILAKIRERGCDLPRGEGGPGFKSPSEFGVLACTHLLHRGPLPAPVKKKKQLVTVFQSGPPALVEYPLSIDAKLQYSLAI